MGEKKKEEEQMTIYILQSITCDKQLQLIELEDNIVGLVILVTWIAHFKDLGAAQESKITLN